MIKKIQVKNYRICSQVTEKKKIVFIVPFLYRYQRGIERSCVYLANSLVELGHQVTLLTWQEYPPKTDFCIHPKIRVVALPNFRFYMDLITIPFYALELLIHRYDVVNIYFSGFGEAQSLRLIHWLLHFQINFIAGYPIEQVPHRFQEFREYGLERLLDNVIVKSPSMGPGIADFFQKDVQVIPNGVDINYFDPGKVDASGLRRQLGLSNKDHVLLTVAALEERKGIQYVIRILPYLLQYGLSLHYIVVGDGPLRKTLETLASEVGVNKYVHFAGAIKDVRPYYKLADIFCLLSSGEGFPNTLLEAWAMKLPVIVSNQPPYPHILKEDFGSLIDPSDIDGLSNTIVAWLHDQEYRSRQGEQARDFVMSNYKWDVIASHFMLLTKNQNKYSTGI
jgi:glycosyltransferase involved in cell wall biosynthesis